MMKIGSCDLTLLSRSEEETFELARKLGQTLQGEEVILLIGELGAGKTLMVAGLAAGLGVNEQTYVCSPSFTLINVYQGRVTLYHLDLYRLSDPEEIVDLGLEDLLGSGIVAIEWAEKLPYEVKGVKVIKIFIEVINEDQRRITISGLEPESDFIGGQDSGKN
jgi:tRNA threonylcarbamoyladenosine biosynthesis protein TsaE